MLKAGACPIGKRARAKQSSQSATANGFRRAHALLAEHRRVIVFAITGDAGTPQEAARRIGAAVAR
jgi:hypothetical protein